MKWAVFTFVRASPIFHANNQQYGNVRPAGLFLVTFYDKDAANTSSIQRFFLGARDGRRNACSGLWAQKLAGKASASVRRVGAKNAFCSVFIEKNDQKQGALSRKERIAATDAVGMLLAKHEKARVEEHKSAQRRTKVQPLGALRSIKVLGRCHNALLSKP